MFGRTRAPYYLHSFPMIYNLFSPDKSLISYPIEPLAISSQTF